MCDGGRIGRPFAAVEKRDFTKDGTRFQFSQENDSTIGRRITDPDLSGLDQHHRRANVSHQEDRLTSAPRLLPGRRDEALPFDRPEGGKDEGRSKSGLYLPSGFCHCQTPLSGARVIWCDARHTVRARGEANPLCTTRRDRSALKSESTMTHITMDVLDRNSSLRFVGRMVQAIKATLVERIRRWSEYRTVAAELRQYSASEIVELGISEADIDYVAADAARHRPTVRLKTAATPE
jgi:uncharacterized protein YjiS (DUF1127 family)